MWTIETRYEDTDWFEVPLAPRFETKAEAEAFARSLQAWGSWRPDQVYRSVKRTDALCDPPLAKRTDEP